MRPTNIDRAIAFALDWLKAKLPPNLTYHNAAHTAEIVMPAAEQLAQMAGVTEEDRHLLAVAAAFHDIGMTVRRDGHEISSMRMAAQLLPAFDFGNDDIDTVCGLILATRLPQTPQTLLEQIMADADLDVLGRDDFFETNEALRLELAAHGESISPNAWNRRQLRFLIDHRYFTAEARQLRDSAKQAHIATLRGLVAPAST